MRWVGRSSQHPESGLIKEHPLRVQKQKEGLLYMEVLMKQARLMILSYLNSVSSYPECIET